MKRQRLVQWLQAAGVWAGASFVLHLAWEIAHARLYTIWSDPDRWYVAWAVLHCTLGDVLISLSGFALVAWLLRAVDWPAVRPAAGAALVASATMLYTAWSEWRNVYQLKSWAYTPDMPTLFDIGLSPLLQWLILISATVLVVRGRFSARRYA